MKGKIIKWLKEILGIASLETQVGIHNHRLLEIENLVQIGVDLGFKSPSWMVVCLRGKNQDIVRFFELPDREISRIFEELKYLEKQYHLKPVFDCPPYIKKEYLRL